MPKLDPFKYARRVDVDIVVEIGEPDSTERHKVGLRRLTIGEQSLAFESAGELYRVYGWEPGVKAAETWLTAPGSDRPIRVTTALCFAVATILAQQTATEESERYTPAQLIVMSETMEDSYQTLHSASSKLQDQRGNRPGAPTDQVPTPEASPQMLDGTSPTPSPTNVELFHTSSNEETISPST